MIEVHGVSYKYPKTDEYVLRSLSLDFRRGEICAVTGPNGCGKTTLTKLMTGVLRPDEGSILIDGCDEAGMGLFEIGQRIGYVFQNPSKQLFCATVNEEIAFGLKNQGMSEGDIEDTLAYYTERFRLSHHRDDYPGRLSQGEKQRVVLAAVLSMGTDYLILDEPTTGLDVRGRHELGEILRGLVRERETGILIVSHERGFISRYADREVVMPR